MTNALLELNEQTFADACNYLIEREPKFLKIKNQFGNPPFWKRDPGFATVVRIILEQQVSIASAKAHYEKLYGHSQGLQPHILLAMSDVEYRQCAISRQKRTYIQDLCTKVNSGEILLDKMDKLDDEMVASMLCNVKGIGLWTASVYMMFCLRRPNHFPAGDIAIIKTVHELFDVPKDQTHEEFAMRWAPYRTVATYFLWWHYLCSRKREALF